jgi:hypothetical protein
MCEERSHPGAICCFRTPITVKPTGSWLDGSLGWVPSSHVGRDSALESHRPLLVADAAAHDFRRAQVDEAAERSSQVAVAEVGFTLA